jgi:hypothetical protein
MVYGFGAFLGLFIDLIYDRRVISFNPTTPLSPL